MDKSELGMLYVIHSVKGIGNRSLWKIKDRFANITSFYEANESTLYKTFLPVEVVEQFLYIRKRVDPFIALEKLRDRGINIITFENDNYSKMLTSIHDPPYILYYMGRIEVLNNLGIAVIGSRTATSYGKIQARRFSQELAKMKITVVSGMARGIDTEAHKGALEAGGVTVAVLGSGLNVIYPAENSKVFYDIVQGGVVISEYPPDTAPEAGNFPVRNRIISGLSRGVLIVEARIKSGALITADFALEQGRDVFAVPGPVSSKNSEGTNGLIKQGAKLVSVVEDITEEYGIIKERLVIQDQLFELDGEESKVIEYISSEPLHIDELIHITGMNLGLLSAVLIKLEMKGIITVLAGNYYVKI